MGSVKQESEKEEELRDICEKSFSVFGLCGCIHAESFIKRRIKVRFIFRS